MNLKTYTKEFSYNLRLAYPIILGMVGHTLVGIVDNIMVGQLGPTELAAVSLGNSFIFIAISLGVGFSTAITPLVAESDGAGSLKRGKSVFHNGLFLCSLIGVLLFLLIFFAKPIITYMGQPEQVVELAKPYLDIVAFSLIPMMMFQAYKQFADGKSQTRYSMWATILGNVLNVILNYFLIFGNWFFPELGIVGCAIGSVIARFSMLIFMHFIMKNKPVFHPYLTGFSFSMLQRSLLKKIASLGTPSAMQMFFEVALFTGAIWLSGRLSVTNQAANQIALSLASLTFMFAMGLSVTAMIRVGNQKGLGDYQKLRIVAISIFLLTIILQVIFALLFVIFHKDLPYLFLNIENSATVTESLEVVSVASTLLLIAAVFQISDGIQATVLGALRGLQDAKVPAIISFISYWVIGFPICIYLGLFTELKASGIWIGLLSGLTVAAILLFYRFNYLTKKMIG